MAKRAVVHIGIDKTGSTTIQRTLFSGRSKLLADSQILYPSIADNQSVYLATIFRDEAPPTLQLIEPGATQESSVASSRKKFRASLEADIARPDWHTLVISAEGLCDFGPKVTSRFIEWLTKHVSEISVVAYVRHPVEWTRSVVQERLKAGETLDQLYKNMRHPNWRQRFTPWLDAVGLEKFRLVSFDEARENEGIMASFCDAAGLPRETVLPLALDTPINESMSLEAALLLDSLNRQRPLFTEGKRSPERRWPGTRTMKLIPGNKFHLSAEHAKKARADNRPDLEWLNATFGTHLFSDVFEDAPLEIRSPPTTMPQETVDALALTLSDLGNRLQGSGAKDDTRSEREHSASVSVEDIYRRLSCYKFARRYVEGESVADIHLEEAEPGPSLLAEYAESVTVLGKSVRGLDETREEYSGENVNYQQAELPDLPCPDDHFGAAIVYGSPKNLEVLIREARRVLAEDGTLLLCAPDIQAQAGLHTTRDSGRQDGLYVPEVRKLLERTFPTVRMYRLGVVAGGLVTGDESDLSALTLDSAGPLGSAPSANGFVIFVCGPVAETTEENPRLILDTEGIVLEEANEAHVEAELLKREIEQMQRTEVRAFREAVDSERSRSRDLWKRVRWQKNRAEELERRNNDLTNRTQMLEGEQEKLKNRKENLERRLQDIESSRLWTLLTLYRRVRSKLPVFSGRG